MYSNPTEEPDFIKPYFGLRLFGVYHIGTDYLHETPPSVPYLPFYLGEDEFQGNLIQSSLTTRRYVLLIALKLNSLSSPRTTTPSLSTSMFNTLLPSAYFNI